MEISDRISSTVDSTSVSQPSLKRLVIKNFRCIGSMEVNIDLADIVVLVGPNNVGKSTLLRAYEVVMSDAKLKKEDFPNSIIDENNLPEIILETVVFENAPAQKWVCPKEHIVKERWIWNHPEKSAERAGFNFEKMDWDKEGVPWGARNVAKAYRPQPHRIEAFDSPEEQTKKIMELFLTILNERVQDLKTQSGSKEGSSYQLLLQKIADVHNEILEEAQKEIRQIELDISNILGEIFPKYQIKFDLPTEQDLDKCLNLFKNGQLLMGPKDGHFSNIENQGSGARRTLLWTALKILAEMNVKKGGKKEKKQSENEEKKPNLLLLDEPEICLHPNAIREACRTLYDLPVSTKNWQVMVTTHSPIFIDISRDNTTVVRVEKLNNGMIQSTTLFRPNKPQLTPNDREYLKIINLYDPYMAEFFFGGYTIIVEGDTEYTAFRHIIGKNPNKFKNVHIIRARGKAIIITLMKILNQFSAPYAVLHDSDTLTYQCSKTNESKSNPAWIINEGIQQEAEKAPSPEKIKIVASLPNFEEAFFNEITKKEKPYTALKRLELNSEGSVQKVELLLEALTAKDDKAQLPEGALRWNDIADLKKKVEEIMQ